MIGIVENNLNFDNQQKDKIFKMLIPRQMFQRLSIGLARKSHIKTINLKYQL